MSKLDSIFSKLDSVAQNNIVTVNVPSVNRLVKFKPISVKQQKDLIKSGLGGINAGIVIGNYISDIIKENCCENIDFLITDKTPIIIALRIASIGSLANVADEDKPVDISSILTKQLDFGTKTDPTSINYQDTLKINLEIPNLKRDQQVNKVLLTEIQKYKEDAAQNAVGDIFIYEIVKFIKSIEIVDDTTIIDFNVLQIKDCVEIVEKMVATINGSILDYIKDLRKVENEYMLIDGKSILIDSKFFIND